MTSGGIPKPYYTAAITNNAEAVTNARSVGVMSNEMTRSALASTRFPGPMGRVSTNDIYQQIGSAELPIAAWGATAESSTQGGAAAVAASNAMQLALPPGPGAARGTTMSTQDPKAPHGAGKTKNVMLAAVGTTDRPAGAFSMVDLGDGPHAVAQAGEANSVSFASADHEMAVTSAGLDTLRRPPVGEAHAMDAAEAGKAAAATADEEIEEAATADAATAAVAPPIEAEMAEARG
jgi:hypothetical protein